MASKVYFTDFRTRNYEPLPKKLARLILTAGIDQIESIKASGAEVGFVDRFSGTLITVGTVSEVEAAMAAVVEYAEQRLGFNVCEITKT